jgi:hypothetical protein
MCPSDIVDASLRHNDIAFDRHTMQIHRATVDRAVSSTSTVDFRCRAGAISIDDSAIDCSCTVVAGLDRVDRAARRCRSCVNLMTMFDRHEQTVHLPTHDESTRPMASTVGHGWTRRATPSNVRRVVVGRPCSSLSTFE